MAELQELHDAIVSGDLKTAAAVVREALAQNVPPVDLAHEAMVPAMAEVGRVFECREHFVPERLLAARAMKAAREPRRPLLAATGLEPAGVQNEWIAAALAPGRPVREGAWTEAVAVGRRSFVERVQDALGPRVWHRQVETIDGGAVLRDAMSAYEAHSSAKMAPPGKKSRLHSPQVSMESKSSDGQTRSPDLQISRSARSVRR